MSASAVNAIVSPWFVRARPAALAMAYNGGSIGGVIFSPLWVAAIGMLGFPVAAAGLGLVVVLTMWALADLGSIVLIAAAGTSVPLLLLGVVLFGLGFGNATSLPPLIAQVEFVKEDVQRVVALIVGMSQGAYAFAPVVFGLIRELAPYAAGAAPGAAPALFAAAALAQGLAIGAFLAGRRR
jgi:hypothetical protein